jgi:glycosyltransferase involved in cell wall biosynthesis
LNAPPRFSLVIPAYNEERCLPRLLDSVDEARRRYRGGEGAIEVIVADNASTDHTPGIARERACQVASVEMRAIAAVRNGGARIATGEILAFTDADMRIHPATFDAIDDVLATGRAVGGATGTTMERWSLGIAMTFALMVPLVWLTGMDTGVVFCRRKDFEAIGGYDESRRVAEDVAFLLALRRLGRTRGQKLARANAAKTIASARKFDEYGDWHYFRLMPKLAARLLVDPRATGEFADQYWYRPKR